MNPIHSRIVPAIAALFTIVAAVSADAAVVKYNFFIDAPNGYPITGLTLYATDGVEEDLLLSPVTIGPAGVFRLTHAVPFTPTAAFIVGITDRDQDDNFDLIMFVNDAYAADAVGHPYSALFPTATNIRHGALGQTIAAAHAGDADARTALLGFVKGDSAAAAHFNPFGSYSITHFTVALPPIGGDVPEPATASLVLLGLAGLTLRRRRRA